LQLLQNIKTIQTYTRYYTGAHAKDDATIVRPTSPQASRHRGFTPKQFGLAR